MMSVIEIYHQLTSPLVNFRIANKPPTDLGLGITTSMWLRQIRYDAQISSRSSYLSLVNYS
jgi:hypothetical protein